MPPPLPPGPRIGDDPIQLRLQVGVHFTLASQNLAAARRERFIFEKMVMLERRQR